MMFMETYGNGYKTITAWRCQGGTTRCIQSPRLTALFVAVVGTTVRGTCAPRIATATTPGAGTTSSGSAL